MASTIYVRENLAVRAQAHVVRTPGCSEALIAVTLYLGVLWYTFVQGRVMALRPQNPTRCVEQLRLRWQIGRMNGKAWIGEIATTWQSLGISNLKKWGLMATAKCDFGHEFFPSFSATSFTINRLNKTAYGNVAKVIKNQLM